MKKLTTQKVLSIKHQSTKGGWSDQSILTDTSYIYAHIYHEDHIIIEVFIDEV